MLDEEFMELQVFELVIVDKLIDWAVDGMLGMAVKETLPEASLVSPILS